MCAGATKRQGCKAEGGQQSRCGQRLQKRSGCKVSTIPETRAMFFCMPMIAFNTGCYLWPSPYPCRVASVVKPATAAASSAVLLNQNAVRKESAPSRPPRPEVFAKQKLAELAAQARRELGLPTLSVALSSHGSKGDLQMLASSTGGPLKPVNTSTPSVWGKPPAPAAEPPAVSPQPTMMSQLPQLQQLLQQAAGKKQASKPTSVISTSTPAPVASKPVSALPQPVMASTPVWPALGMAQTSAATLFSTASGPSTQLSIRESTPQPDCPAPTWGSTTAPAVASMPQQHPAQQASTASNSSSIAGAAGRPHPGVDASASLPTTACSVPAPACAEHSAAATLSVVVTSAGSQPASGLETSETAVSSGWVVALDVQPAVAPVPATGTSARAGLQLVGADFVDDEIKEPKLTKAQKKNLKRAEKKRSPMGMFLDQQQGIGEGPPQEASEVPSRASLDSGAAIGPSSLHSAVGVGAISSHCQADPPTTSETGLGGGCGRSSNGPGDHSNASHASEDPESTHIAEAEEAADMEELCIDCIVARKVLSLILQLQRLGALEFVAVAAVQRHGSNMLAALEWLLIAGMDAAMSQPESVLTAAAESRSAAESEIDISEELQQLHELQAAMGVPTEFLHQCILDCNGDVQTASNTAMERMLSGPLAGTSGSATVGAAMVRESSRSTMNAIVGQADGASMHGCSSFYSVSSLDGMVSVPDSEATLRQQQPPKTLQHQQQARSAHFRVQLQDEPAGCSEASSSGCGVGDTISHGFLRGSGVLGAGGWSNGFLRETAPPPGFPPGSSPANTSTGPLSSAAGGRSTSRLLHWLRDDSGRAAALEEDQDFGPASRGGGLSALGSDPVLDSPFSASGGSRGVACVRGSWEDMPSLTYWLRSNGYHHGSPGTMGGGAVSAAVSVPSGTHGCYGSAGGEASHSNFSFMSALSKPGSLASQGVMNEGHGGYGSRWVSFGVLDAAQRQAAPTGLGIGVGAAESELAAHTDNDELSSIMALINVR